MRLSAISTASVLTFFGLLAACAAPTDAPTEDSEDALVNSPRDLKNTWAVGVCNSAPNTDPAKGNIGACVVPGTRCSGSLVGKNLVLTARHCIAEVDFTNAPGFCDAKFKPTPSPTPASITVDPSVLAANPTWTKVVEITTPTGVNACDDDIALLRLETNLVDSVTPIRLDLRNMTRVVDAPRSAAIVGRGVITDMIDPTTLQPIDEAEGELLRRYAENIPVRCYSDKPGACSTVDISSPPSNHFTLSTGQFMIGARVAGGDSGSGILSQASFTANAPVAFGVTSIATYGKSGAGNAGIGVRLDRHKSWLVPAARAAALAGNYVSAWAGKGPTPVGHGPGPQTDTDEAP
ncbi:MAG: Trypsin-like serine protease [Labilithrix sp.]|nr:Trypsin-like serine protease [Labilithrix sp.]